MKNTFSKKLLIFSLLTLLAAPTAHAEIDSATATFGLTTAGFGIAFGVIKVLNQLNYKNTLKEQYKNLITEDPSESLIQEYTGLAKSAKFKKEEGETESYGVTIARLKEEANTYEKAARNVALTEVNGFNNKTKFPKSITSINEVKQLGKALYQRADTATAFGIAIFATLTLVSHFDLLSLTQKALA